MPAPKANERRCLDGSSFVLTGPLCAGKTTLAEWLGGRGWTVVTARQVLTDLAGRHALDRGALVRLGQELEDQRPGRWLAEVAAKARRPVVLDAARTRAQVREARRMLDEVLVVHLNAPTDVRRARFVARGSTADPEASFEGLNSSPLEREAAELGVLADVVLASGEASPNALGEQVIAACSERPAATDG
jgi:dephospho-CoA kinase